MNGRALLAIAAVLGALALPAAAQPPAGLVPVQVALDALPRAVRTAVLEARDQLLADTARRQLEDTAAYVQGFQQLPAGRSALADPKVQQAYAWVEDAVGTLLAVPEPLEAAEAAGAFCESYGASRGVAAGLEAVRRGRQALGALQGVAGAIDFLRTTAPQGLGLDLAPFEAAAAELADWRTSRGAEVAACLDELDRELARLEGRDPTEAGPVLAAILVPGTTWRTGSFRILGAWPSGPVAVRAPSLGLDRSVAADGSFQVQAQVPRTAELGSHAILVQAGGQRVELDLQVILAPSTLALHAPGEVRPGATFRLRATVSSPAGLREVDLGRVAVDWNGTTRTLSLDGGVAGTRFDAGGVEREARLAARYSGTDVVAPAEAELTLRIEAPAIATPPPEPEPEGPLGVLAGIAPAASLLLLLILLLLAALLAWRLWRRRPQPADRAAPDAPLWPRVGSYAAAVGILFALLRRLRLVPPGRTVREWAVAGHAPVEVADAFEKVRYGGRPEGATLRTRGISWIRNRWERP